MIYLPSPRGRAKRPKSGGGKEAQILTFILHKLRLTP